MIETGSVVTVGFGAGFGALIPKSPSRMTSAALTHWSAKNLSISESLIRPGGLPSKPRSA
jgi:hypothetical protein